MIPPPVAGGARKKAYVYLLKNRVDGTLYLGWTTNVLRRLVEHNEGRSSFTRRKQAWQLVGVETHQTCEAAKVRERSLKRNAHMFALFKKRVLNPAASGGQRQVGG